MSCVGCSVLNCFNNKQDTPNKQFHFFPKNENLCRIWVEKTNPALATKPMSCIRGYLVCSDHFEPCQYTTPEKIKLNRGSIPKLKLPDLRDKIDLEMDFEDNEIEKVVCQNIEDEYTNEILLGIKSDQTNFDEIESPKLEDTKGTKPPIFPGDISDKFLNV